MAQTLAGHVQGGGIDVATRGGEKQVKKFTVCPVCRDEESKRRDPRATIVQGGRVRAPRKMNRNIKKVQKRQLAGATISPEGGIEGYFGCSRK